VTPDQERLDFLDLMALPPGAALLEVDGTPRVDLPSEAYDGILCVDGIARARNRLATLTAWARALKPAGRLLYTDPTLVAGAVTSDEIAERSGAGVLSLAPQGENESLLESAGFRLLRADDATDAIAAIAEAAWRDRLAREAELVAAEGLERYHVTQRRLAMTHRLAAERRLARIAFLAEKLG
jgi:SAM-dependent methyltransferase